MQGSLPAGWLAFTGRELNPLDRDEGFQITSSSLPGLFLAQRPKAFNEEVAGGRAAGAMGICARQTNWLTAADTHECVGRRRCRG